MSVLEWFTNLFQRSKNAVYINNVYIGCECSQCDNPSGVRPKAPAAPIIRKGDSVTMIQYPVEVLAGPESDIKETQIAYQVEGADETVMPAVAGNGVNAFIIVPETSNGAVRSRFIDVAGNPGKWSPDAVWTNASDTTPPASPAAAPNMGQGQTV